MMMMMMMMMMMRMMMMMMTIVMTMVRHTFVLDASDVLHRSRAGKGRDGRTRNYY